MAKLNFSIALGLAANNFKQGLSNVQNQLNGFAKSVKSMFGMVAGAFAAGQIKAFSKECLDAYSAQLQAEQKLGVIMKQRMGVTDAEVKSVMNLASAQQKLGVIGDEVQLAGAQQVATFLNEKKSLDTLIPAMNNLLAQQKGLSATQGDAVNIGNLMGKVMQGQTSALKRVGISFDEAQEKILKYGTEEQKAATLAQVIKDNVGDMNAALAETDAGKIQQLNNTLGDLKEQIGAALMPLLGQLAPKIEEFATNGANAVVGFINAVQQNIQALVGFIVMQFAGIGLVKIFSQWLASFKAHSAQLEATASVSATKRKAIEDNLHKTINRLKVLEAQKAEATGAKLVQIEQEITTKRAALKKQLVARNEACEAEIVAANQAAAFKTASVWGKGMMMAKMSFIGFMTTVKTLFRSFAPLLIFELLFTVGMKVYDMLSKNSKGFMALAKVVGGAVFQAISLLAEGLAKIFDYVADLFGLVDKSNKKYRSKKTGKVYNSMEELNAAEGKGSKAKPSPSSPSPVVDTKTTTTKEKTPAEQAAEDVAKAEQEYSKSIKKAQLAVDLSTDKEKAGTEAKQQQVSALKSLYDTYAEAWAVTGNEGYKSKMQELMSQMEQLGISVEAADEATKAMKDAEAKAAEKVEKIAEARNTMKSELSDLDKKTAGGRDTTFDYKFTGKGADNLKLQADIEFNLENAQKRLEILKKAAEEGCTEAINQIADAEKDVTSLEDQLKLAKVKEDVESLQKELSNLTIEGIQQGWQAVEGTVSSISSLVDTLSDPDASGWEKFAAVINTVMSLMQTFMGILEMINTITEVSTKLTQADAIQKQAAAASNVAAAGSEAAAETSLATAEGGEAIAGATKSGAGLPFPLNIVAIAAGVAAVVTALATAFSKGGVARFAGGGIFGGNTPNGDFGLARVNSGEMILNNAQQDRLFRIANGTNSARTMSGQVEFKLTGKELRGVLNNTNTRDSRVN